MKTMLRIGVPLLLAFTLIIAGALALFPDKRDTQGSFWFGLGWNGTGFTLEWFHCLDFDTGEYMPVDFSPTLCETTKSDTAPASRILLFVAGEDLELVDAITKYLDPSVIEFTDLRAVDPKTKPDGSPRNGSGPAGSKVLDCTGQALGDECFIRIAFEDDGGEYPVTELAGPLTGVATINVPFLEGDLRFSQLTRASDGSPGL